MTGRTSSDERRRSLMWASIAAVNVTLLLALLVLVEVVFGNWVRPLTVRDLKRFSIPIGVSYRFDPSRLYPSRETTATYTRNEWGLRGSTADLSAIDLITVGGSTTDQRYLDDSTTWQAVAERELRKGRRRLVFANAGVDGQSTVGHLFSLRHWFPLLPGLHPRVVLFYVGINDILKPDDRDAYDGSLDATSWRMKSILFQLYRTVRGTLRARDVGITHGRSRRQPSDFTDHGLLPHDDIQRLAGEITAGFMLRVDSLRDAVLRWNAVPVFVTQTAYGWNGDQARPRGLKDTVRSHGRIMNFADVAALHQHLNRSLMEHCRGAGIVCFDLASDVAFVADDYYDLLHNTPEGAEKIGRYLAEHLAALDLGSVQSDPPGAVQASARLERHR